MIFLTVLASFIVQLSDVTIVTCDAPWVEQARLADILETELNEIPKEYRTDLILVMDGCTKETLRLRVSAPGGQYQRTVQINEIPEEARMRTIALTFGELLQDVLQGNREVADTFAAPAPTTENLNGNEAANAVDQTESAAKETPPRVKAPERVLPRAPTKPEANAPKKYRDVHRLMAGAGLRAFPVAKTLAPEARIGILLPRWRFDFRAFGMVWKKSQLGDIWLTAATLTAGPTLWRYEGKTRMGIDALMELGAIIALGKAANNNVDDTIFNVASGAHLAFWLGIPTATRFQPTLVLEGGWIRGLNVYAGEDIQGGFEGPATSVIIAGVW